MVPSVAGRVDEQVHHLLAGERVERAGRLVGEHDRGSVDQRAGDGDPLRLAARQLARAPVRASPLEPEPVEPRRGARSSASRRRPAVEQQRQGDVLHRAVSSGTSWPNWNTKPNSRPAQRAALGLAERRRCGAPSKLHLAGVGHEDAGQAVQQRRLARAARAHDGEDLAAPRSARSAPRSAGVAPNAARSVATSIGAARAGRRSGAVSVIVSSDLAARGRRAARRSARSSAGRPRGGTGRGRRAGRRRRSPLRRSSVSSRMRAHVGGALGVEDARRPAARASAPARPWRTAPSAGAARAATGSASQRSSSVTPSSVIDVALAVGPAARLDAGDDDLAVAGQPASVA